MPIEIPTGPGGADRGKTAAPGDPCYLCEVVAGHSEKAIVEETETTLTLVNWKQYELGQVYVIPRRHAPTLLDLTDEEGGRRDSCRPKDRRCPRAGVRPRRAQSDPEQRRHRRTGCSNISICTSCRGVRVGSNWGTAPHIAVLEGKAPSKPSGAKSLK